MQALQSNEARLEIDWGISDPTALLRLMQLVSPSLPIGGFTYSQGLEWAVHNRWVLNKPELHGWLQEQIDSTLTHVDFPLLLRLYSAAQRQDCDAFLYWSEFLLATRETSEIRQEERNRGRALHGLLDKLDMVSNTSFAPALKICQASGFAWAAYRWAIPKDAMLMGYGWSWLENLVLAGVKIIPLGQTEGQQLLRDLIVDIPSAVARAATLADHELGASNPALAIASSQHEFQYTRLFRS